MSGYRIPVIILPCQGRDTGSTPVTRSKSDGVSDYLAKNSFGTVVPYTVVLEAATALSRDTKINRLDLAAKMLASYAKLENKPKLDENITKSVSESFQKNTSRKNTRFDHYLCALAKKNGIRYVFSFDSFYKKQGLILARDLLKQ